MSTFSGRSFVIQSMYVAADPVQQLKHHDWATRLGRSFVIAGACVAATGGALCLVGLSVPESKTNDARLLFVEAGAVIGSIGAELALFGGTTYFFGKRFEKRHPERYSISVGMNRIGMALHF